jgi:hypothetical protein
MNAQTSLKIEHCDNTVYAVHTPDGPAIYPILQDLATAIQCDDVEVSEGDPEYYAARTWHPVDRETLAEYGL